RLGDIEAAIEVERSVEDPGVASRKRHRVERQKGPVGVVTPARVAPPREAANPLRIERRTGQPIDQLAEGDLALAAHGAVEVLAIAGPDLVGEHGGVIAAQHVYGVRRGGAYRGGKLPRRLVLERHGRVAGEVGPEAPHLVQDARPHAVRTQDEIENAHLVLGHLGGERAQPEVRELHDGIQRGCRVRHGEQQNAHDPSNPPAEVSCQRVNEWNDSSIFNAAPFVVVTLLSLGQLSSGVGRWISSVAMSLIGAVYIVWLLLDAPSSWILWLPAISMVTVALTVWYGDAALRRAGIIGSAIGVLGLSVLGNATLWRTVFLSYQDSPRGPSASSSTSSNVLFAGVLLGYLGGVIVFVLVGVASRLRSDVARPDRP